MKKIFCLLILTLSFIFAKSQNEGGITVFGTIYKGDTIALAYLDPVIINGYIPPLTDKERRQYSKLIKDVKKTYPIAKQVQQLLASYSNMLDKAQNESQKEKIRKQAYNDVKDKFYDKTKKLSKNQGKLLSKLIQRQTGMSSYTLIKNFGGGVRATMAQTTAKAVGVNLNTNFDTQNNEEDRIIERIIYCIEAGKL